MKQHRKPALLLPSDKQNTKLCGRLKWASTQGCLLEDTRYIYTPAVLGFISGLFFFGGTCLTHYLHNRKIFPEEEVPCSLLPKLLLGGFAFLPPKDGFEWDDRSNSCFLFIPAPLPHPHWPSKLRPLQAVTQHPLPSPCSDWKIKMKA